MLQHWEENSSIGVRTYDSPWGQSVLERYPTYFPPQVLFLLLIPRSGADLTFKMFGFTEAARWRQIGAAVPFTLSQVWLLTAQQKQTSSSFLPPIRRSTARRASPSVVVNTDTIWLQCSNPNIVMWFLIFFFFWQWWHIIYIDVSSFWSAVCPTRVTKCLETWFGKSSTFEFLADFFFYIKQLAST